MKRFAKLLLVTFGFGVFGFAMSLVPQKTATGAGGAPVTVMNTPLPVTGIVGATQSGAWNVGINNTPSVNAAQSGAWNVGINNFPSTLPVSGTVNVGNFPSLLAANITNTSSTPLFVDTDRAAREQVVGQCSAQLPSSANFSNLAAAHCSPDAAVPQGQTLVIDSVSILVVIQAGQSLVASELGISEATYYLALIKQGSDGTSDYYAYAGPMTLYSGSSPTFYAFTTDTSGSGVLRASVAGHLVTP